MHSHRGLTPTARAWRGWRRRALAWLLPVVMLLAQQGAITHELGHLRVAAAVRHASIAAGDLACPACLAFAPLLGLAPAPAVAQALLSFVFTTCIGSTPACIAADAPTARSRGPPAPL